MHGAIWGLASAFVFFALYVELHPGMRNIWWRTGVNGLKEFRPWNLFNLMGTPLFSLALWNPRVWDINFPVVAFIGGLLGYFLA